MFRRLGIDGGTLLRVVKFNLQSFALENGILRKLEIFDERGHGGQAVVLILVLQVGCQRVRGDQLLEDGQATALAEMLPLHKDNVGVGKVDQNLLLQLVLLPSCAVA